MEVKSFKELIDQLDKTIIEIYLINDQLKEKIYAASDGKVAEGNESK